MIYSRLMNPKQRSAAFLAVTFVLMAPYLGFVMYLSLHLPQKHWPAWATNTIALWFAANFLVLALVATKMFRKQPVARQSAEETKKASAVLVLVPMFGLYLVIVWTGLFLYGAKETIEGKYLLSRAIPAGAFLLLSIGIFSWSLYRSWRKRT